MADQPTAPSRVPQIFTSSWRATVRDPPYCRIGISRGTPRNQTGYRRYPKLHPGEWFRSIADERVWAARYRDEILSVLDPGQTVDELLAMAEGRPPVLLCWEPPQPGDDFCHRGLVAAWLWETLKLDVLELGHEAEGCGWSHPKLPRSLRRPITSK